MNRPQATVRQMTLVCSLRRLLRRPDPLPSHLFEQRRPKRSKHAGGAPHLCNISEKQRAQQKNIEKNCLSEAACPRSERSGDAVQRSRIVRSQGKSKRHKLFVPGARLNNHRDTIDNSHTNKSTDSRLDRRLFKKLSQFQNAEKIQSYEPHSYSSLRQFTGSVECVEHVCLYEADIFETN